MRISPPAGNSTSATFEPAPTPATRSVLPQRWLWSLAGLLCLAGAAAVTVDIPVAHALLKQRVLRSVHRPLQIAEPFGDAAGVIALVVAMCVLDPVRRRFAPRVLACGLAGGLLADVGKLLIVRTRPTRLDFALVRNGWDTFGQWLPLIQGNAGSQSFPSAHTASAWALAVALLTLYPRGRWLFPALAFLVAFQRVETGAHYVSDALCGAALGLIVGSLFHGRNPLAAAFDRYEARPGVPLTETDADSAVQASPGESRRAA